MNQAITTKYHGPTNTKGSRISATSASGIRVYVPYAYELSTNECHTKAAEVLRAQLGWEGRLVGGCNATGNVYVLVNGEDVT